MGSYPVRIEDQKKWNKTMNKLADAYLLKIPFTINKNIPLKNKLFIYNGENNED